MDIAIAVVLLVVALFLVVKGGDVFVSSSAVLAKKAHIPQIIFGATFMSLATTFSELIIGIISSIDGTTDLAVGNAVGSALCNVGLVMAIGICFMPSKIGGGGMLKYYLLIVATIFVTVIGFFNEVTIWQAFVMIAITILFFVFNYIDAKNMETHSKGSEDDIQRPLWLAIILFLLGAAAIGGGAYLLVDKVEYLSGVIGISEQFVGLTVVAIGTSLPELVTVITSLKKKTPYLAMGNIVGSNILNLTLILGVSRLVAWNDGMPITNETAYISLPLAMLFTLILILPILVKKKTYRWQGIVLLILYVLYIAFLILNAVFKFV